MGLTIWILWVDDCVSVGKKESVLQANMGMMDWLDCNEVGKLTEFVGCKLDREVGKLRITQPVLMQSFVDEFNLQEGLVAVTPALPGLVLMKEKEDEAVNVATQSLYRLELGN